MLRHFAALSWFAIAAVLGCADGRDSAVADPIDLPTTAPESELRGRLLLPGDGGRRGVEVHTWIKDGAGDRPRQLWLLPDADGHFSRLFKGELVRVSVSAGSEVHRIDTPDLPGADRGGRVDLGDIDLRDRLVPRRMRVVGTGDGGTGDGETGGALRLGLWIGPPHTGPRGELPSLGSKQFPTVALDSQVEWLLPPDADRIHFLVERPAGPDHEAVWRSGESQVFGPYGPTDFPLELHLK